MAGVEPTVSERDMSVLLEALAIASALMPRQAKRYHGVVAASCGEGLFCGYFGRRQTGGEVYAKSGNPA
jgi:hypothetical protein